MFRVPTYLAASRIQGLGAFTSVAIPAGTLIWEFTPEVDWRFSPEELDAFPNPYRTRLRQWCYQEESGLFVLCGDNAKFMNHSGDPNCDDDGEYTTAARDIAAFEELTCDYRRFDVLSRDGRGEPFLSADSVETSR